MNTNYLLLKSDAKGYSVVKRSDIVYLEAQEQYTKVHVLGEPPLLISRILKHFETLLCEGEFVRIHQSYIINLSYLRRYNNTEGYEVVLKNGTQIPIARARRKEFTSIFLRA